MRKKIIRACTVSQSLSFIEEIIPQLKQLYDVSLLASPEETAEQIENQYGVKFIPVQMKRHISLLHDVKSLLHIVYVFCREKPDIVHSMTPKAGFLCMIAAWLCRVPIRIHTFTGLVWPTSHGFKRKILMLTDKITCACATHINPEGEGVKNDLVLGKITRKSLKVLGFGNVKGVDMLRFSKRPEINALSELIRDDTKFTFLYVGRIVHEKGIDELVEAFGHLKKKYENIRLVLVGGYDCSLDPISETTIREIAHNDAIDAVGPKSTDVLIGYYASSDCFVFPSYREGFPNVVLEAGAMGLPSIVTDINGSREIIIQGENGIIVPPKDESALYEAMEHILTNQECTLSMACKSRKMIESRFDNRFVQKCLLDFYTEIFYG